MDKIENTKVSLSDKLANIGLVMLAISVMFSITLMNVSTGILLLALILKLIKKEIKLTPTGLESYLLVFILCYVIGALLGPRPFKSLKDVSNNYWYIIQMYIVIYLFGKKEIQKFSKIICYSAFAISLYALLQSFFGWTLLGGLNIIEGLRMGSRNLEKVFTLNSLDIYMATGILGHHLTFGGQMLMLTFVSSAVFSNFIFVIPIFLSLLLSFSYSSWLGFAAALLFLFFYRKRKSLTTVLLFLGIVAAFIIAPGNLKRLEVKFADRVHIWKTAIQIYKRSPIVGVGAGQYKYIFDKYYAEQYTGSLHGVRSHPHSIYLDMLTEGGAITLIAFLVLIFKFFMLYRRVPKDNDLKKIYLASYLALTAILFAGFFQTYLTDAENSVLIWTLAGMIVAIKKQDIRDEVIR